MQSGRAKAGDWMLEYERNSFRAPEPLMGWTRAGDTNNQVVLKFASRDDAIAFAREQGWVADIQDFHKKKITPRSYLDNFRYHDPA
jgi:hypothetical protein